MMRGRSLLFTKIAKSVAVALLPVLIITACGSGAQESADKDSVEIRDENDIPLSDSVEGELDDENSALRSRPKAGGTPNIDQNVIAQGNDLWQGGSYKAIAQDALNLVNQNRANAGLPALAWNDNLAACAMIRASELPAAFSHTRPNGSAWYTVMPDLMYGENLGHGYYSAGDIVTAWMNSPTHRENILTPGFGSCGIGLYEVNGKWYWAQEFNY
jgi:uncharacterized protein YkwD